MRPVCYDALEGSRERQTQDLVSCTSPVKRHGVCPHVVLRITLQDGRHDLGGHEFLRESQPRFPLRI